MDDLKNKDISISNLLHKIFKQIDSNLFEVKDYWEADTCAIGLVYKDKLIYLSTWEFQDENGELCYAQFEFLNDDTNRSDNTLKTFKSINIENLVQEIKTL